jgi:hypothetical protein
VIRYIVRQALPAIILLGLTLTLSIAALPGASAKVATQDSNIYTIKEAGLQFEVPKGWKVEVDNTSKNVVVSVEDGAVSVTFVVEDDYAGVLTGMKQGLGERLTEMKSDGDQQHDTHNGMTHIAETGTGQLKGNAVRWSIDVLKAGKPVTILTFGLTKVMDAHVEEYTKLVVSMKKV